MSLLTQYAKTCSKFTALLGEFYPEFPDHPALEAALIPPVEIPEPMRSLLVHNRDMTSTLAQHYGDEIKLQELERHETESQLTRHIVLQSATTRQPVEYGASRINLNVLDPVARKKVLEGREPLGGILNTHGIKYTSCPGGFFRVEPNEFIRTALKANATDAFFGRCNCLTSATGDTIAEVVEVLPSEIQD
jgi:hypothetical protein